MLELAWKPKGIGVIDWVSTDSCHSTTGALRVQHHLHPPPSSLTL